MLIYIILKANKHKHNKREKKQFTEMKADSKKFLMKRNPRIWYQIFELVCSRHD